MHWQHCPFVLKVFGNDLHFEHEVATHAGMKSRQRILSYQFAKLNERQERGIRKVGLQSTEAREDRFRNKYGVLRSNP